jgi:hypothetical protein
MLNHVLKLNQTGLAYAGNPNTSFPDDSNADVVQCRVLVQVESSTANFLKL